MGRRAREISETGLYHIVFRGINKQHIFEESVDYNKMKSILKEIKEEMKFEIYVYCFMTNHVRPLLSFKFDIEYAETNIKNIFPELVWNFMNIPVLEKDNNNQNEWIVTPSLYAR